MASTKTTTAKSKFEILCGRGRSFDQYPGNQIFRHLIKEHEATYSEYRNQNNRPGITSLIRLIYGKLNEEGMRFIKKSKAGNWINLEDSESKLKIGHALRDMKPVKQKQVRRERKRSHHKKAPRIRLNNKIGSPSVAGVVGTTSSTTNNECVSLTISQQNNNSPTSVNEGAFARRVSMDHPCQDLMKTEPFETNLFTNHNDGYVESFHDPSMLTDSNFTMIENEVLVTAALNQNTENVDYKSSMMDDHHGNFSIFDVDISKIFTNDECILCDDDIDEAFIFSHEKYT